MNESLPQWLTEIVDGVPPLTRLPTLQEHLTRLSEIEDDHRGRVRRTPLGHSRQGRPLDMLSVGDGPCSILVVGGPHPNEPTSSLAIPFLLDRIAGDSGLARRLGATWHFIGCIDPDGHVRNEGWMVENPSVADYLRGFFRPALADQPEYSFPLSTDRHRFTASTPENLAWQSALERTRPAVQVSLHNVDIGGAFFLVSDPDTALAALMQLLPGRFQTPVSRLGEPLAAPPTRWQGIFPLPDIGALSGSNWSAGDSSAGFSRRYGSYSVVAETPIFDHPELRDSDASSETMVSVFAEHGVWLGRTARLLAEWVGELPGSVRSEQPLVVRSIEESLSAATRNPTAEDIRGLGPMATSSLSRADATSLRTQLRLASLRGPAMLARLAGECGGPRGTGIGESAGAVVVEGMAGLDGGIHAADLRSAVAIQCGAVLVAASRRVI